MTEAVIPTEVHKESNLSDEQRKQILLDSQNQINQQATRHNPKLMRTNFPLDGNSAFRTSDNFFYKVNVKKTNDGYTFAFEGVGLDPDEESEVQTESINAMEKTFQNEVRRHKANVDTCIELINSFVEFNRGSESKIFQKGDIKAIFEDAFNSLASLKRVSEPDFESKRKELVDALETLSNIENLKINREDLLEIMKAYRVLYPEDEITYPAEISENT